MRRTLVAAVVPLWLCGLAAPSVALGQSASATTRSEPGEDCTKLAKRVYGSNPSALAFLQAKNPGLCGKPLLAGMLVQTPPLPQKTGAAKKAASDLPRLSYVGPAVRTKTKGGWMEALPGQPIDKKMRIETSSTGGAEVNVENKVKLQLDPNSTMVIKNLPRAGKTGGGEVQLVDGTLRAGMAETKEGAKPAAPLTVKMPTGEVKLSGGARIDADGKQRSMVSVYQGSVSVRSMGTMITIRAGQGTLILQGQAAQQPKDLPTAPLWSGKGQAPAADEATKPFLVIAVGGLLESQPKGEVVVDFAPVAGAANYSVEIARDAAFNDRKAGGEIPAPPLKSQLAPGQYFARVSALDAERLVGPPSPVRSFYVITLRSNASVVGVPVQDGGVTGGVQMMLVRAESAVIQASGAGLPLQLSVDGGLPLDCRNERGVTLGPGEHRLKLSLADAQSELLVSVSQPPPPPPAYLEPQIEPIEVPVPVYSAGFPGRSVTPRTRVYGLLGFGSTLTAKTANVFRFDLGGELSLLKDRLSIEANLPLLYYSSLYEGAKDDNTVALSDMSLGAKVVAVSAFERHLLLVPMLRLQLPTRTFNDQNGVRMRPVTIDPALGLAALVGPLGLQTTQGLTTTVNVPSTQLRWTMGYGAEYRFWKLGLLAQLDAAVGISGAAQTGAALGGGLRLQLGPWNVLTGVRGGLGAGGQDVFGRYYFSLGLEWAPGDGRH